jgi:hypothetical protein
VRRSTAIASPARSARPEHETQRRIDRQRNRVNGDGAAKEIKGLLQTAAAAPGRGRRTDCRPVCATCGSRLQHPLNVVECIAPAHRRRREPAPASRGLRQGYCPGQCVERRHAHVRHDLGRRPQSVNAEHRVDVRRSPRSSGRTRDRSRGLRRKQLMLSRNPRSLRLFQWNRAPSDRASRLPDWP